MKEIVRITVLCVTVQTRLPNGSDETNAESEERKNHVARLKKLREQLKKLAENSVEYNQCNAAIDDVQEKLRKVSDNVKKARATAGATSSSDVRTAVNDSNPSQANVDDSFERVDVNGIAHSAGTVLHLAAALNGVAVAKRNRLLADAENELRKAHATLRNMRARYAKSPAAGKLNFATICRFLLFEVFSTT